MRNFTRIYAWWTRSIRWKLVGVLIAISVVPMLILTDIVTQVVQTTFNNDVEFWLYQTSRYFVAEILEEERESAKFADILVENGSLNRLISGVSNDLPRASKRMIRALGYNLLVIFKDDQVFFSSKPITSLNAVPFADGHMIYLYRDGKTTMLMKGGSHRFTFHGHSFRILLGDLIDENLSSNLSAMVSLAIRLYYQVNGEFVQMYSSRQQLSLPIPQSITNTLEAGTGTGSYVSAKDSNEHGSFGIYSPLRSKGTLVGVVFCGLTSKGGLIHWLTRRNLFFGIFAFGMLLSVGVGLSMSQFLTRSLIRLSNGVNAIAKGDFSQRVPVGRDDELGQLAIAFNSMASRLEGLRKMEAQLRRRERLTTLGEVAAGLAHEVRNPLGIIKTSAELLSQSQNLTAVEARRLGYVVDEVRRIEQLVRDFLTFAKPPRRTADILAIDLIRHVLGICQSEIERVGVEVRIDDKSGGTKVLLDFDQMIQTCLNLVLNAVQAMDNAKLPVTEAPAPEHPTLDIHITVEDEEIHFVFADNGPGIPAHLIHRIFDPFVTTKDTGTGLGLARALAVVEGHGGWIEARNAVRGGAVIEIAIPLSDRRT